MRARTRTALALLIVLVAAPGRAQNDGLKPGDVLDQTTWQKAEKLLPPEVLQHYRDDKYKNTITSWPQDRITWPEDFKAGTDKNGGRFKIGSEGEILDK